MTSGKSVALVQSRATDFPAVINVGYCPHVRAITNTYYTAALSGVAHILSVATYYYHWRNSLLIEKCLLLDTSHISPISEGTYSGTSLRRTPLGTKLSIIERVSSGQGFIIHYVGYNLFGIQ